MNDAWVNLCGFDPEESIGEVRRSESRSNSEPFSDQPRSSQTLGILQGPRTDENALFNLERAILRGKGRPEATLINYAKGGRAFRNKLEVSFVMDEMTGETVGLMGVLREEKEMTA